MTAELPSDETIRLVYEHVRGVLREQAGTAQQLDSKVLSSVAVGGVALGFSGTSAIGSTGPAVGSLILAALVAFSVLAGIAIVQLRPQRFYVSDDAPGVWALWDQTPTVVMHALIQDIVEGYEKNQNVLTAKAKRVRWALWALTIEIAFVALAIAVSAFSA